MKKLIVIALLVVLTATTAFALEAPKVTTPVAGTVLGPNYDVEGSMPYRAFIIVITDCVEKETGNLVRSVPGIRHWTFNDGKFHFRVASPRVSIGEKGAELIYKVRVFESTAQGHGPETVIECQMGK